MSKIWCTPKRRRGPAEAPEAKRGDGPREKAGKLFFAGRIAQGSVVWIYHELPARVIAPLCPLVVCPRLENLFYMCWMWNFSLLVRVVGGLDVLGFFADELWGFLGDCEVFWRFVSRGRSFRVCVWMLGWWLCVFRMWCWVTFDVVGNRIGYGMVSEFYWYEGEINLLWFEKSVFCNVFYILRI